MTYLKFVEVDVPDGPRVGNAPASNWKGAAIPDSDGWTPVNTEIIGALPYGGYRVRVWLRGSW